jgi:arsenite methyltransferase
MKLDKLESDCEDYGQAVAYKGGIPENDLAFMLDEHHYFPKGKVITVCGNTHMMLHDTRFAKYFDFYGTWDTHYGIFEGCGGNMPFTKLDGTAADCC